MSVVCATKKSRKRNDYTYAASYPPVTAREADPDVQL